MAPLLERSKPGDPVHAGSAACKGGQRKDSSEEGWRVGAGQPQGWGLSGAGALPYSLAAHGAPSPSGTACKPEALFQGTEGAEPGEGGLAPGTAQQPRVHGVALPGLGRAKGWSFDGKREVRGAQAPKRSYGSLSAFLSEPRPCRAGRERGSVVLEGVSCRRAHATRLPAATAWAGHLTAPASPSLPSGQSYKYLTLELPLWNFGDLTTTFMTDFYRLHVPPVLAVKYSSFSQLAFLTYSGPKHDHFFKSWAYCTSHVFFSTTQKINTELLK